MSAGHLVCRKEYHRDLRVSGVLCGWERARRGWCLAVCPGFQWQGAGEAETWRFSLDPSVTWETAQSEASVPSDAGE
jgi:hypothetical protein